MMDTVYMVSKNTLPCFVTDNEEDTVKYLDSKGAFNNSKAEEWFAEGVKSIMDWLNDGHLVEELNEVVSEPYQIDMYDPDIDYDDESPYYLTDNWR